MNTSNLTPVIELAKQNGALTNPSKDIRFDTDFDATGEMRLEAFRQAVIADFVKSLEPAAYKWQWDKGLEWHYGEYQSSREYYDIKPLYELSEFKDTK